MSQSEDWYREQYTTLAPKLRTAGVSAPMWADLNELQQRVIRAVLDDYVENPQQLAQAVDTGLLPNHLSQLV